MYLSSKSVALLTNSRNAGSKLSEDGNDGISKRLRTAIDSGLHSDFGQASFCDDGRKGNRFVSRKVRMLHMFSRRVVRSSVFGGDGNWDSWWAPSELEDIVIEHGWLRM